MTDAITPDELRGQVGAGPLPIAIEISDDTARGIYANMLLITNSETEFTLDFIFLQPQAPKQKILTRIICTPILAKRILQAMGENVMRYEAANGPVIVSEKPRTIQ